MHIFSILEHISGWRRVPGSVDVYTPRLGRDEGDGIQRKYDMVESRGCRVTAASYVGGLDACSATGTVRLTTSVSNRGKRL